MSALGTKVDRIHGEVMRAGGLLVYMLVKRSLGLTNMRNALSIMERATRDMASLISELEERE